MVLSRRIRWAEECKQKPSNTFPLQNTQMGEQTSTANYHNESKLAAKYCDEVMKHVAQSLHRI